MLSIAATAALIAAGIETYVWSIAYPTFALGADLWLLARNA